MIPYHHRAPGFPPGLPPRSSPRALPPEPFPSTKFSPFSLSSLLLPQYLSPSLLLSPSHVFPSSNLSRCPLPVLSPCPSPSPFPSSKFSKFSPLFSGDLLPWSRDSEHWEIDGLHFSRLGSRLLGQRLAQLLPPELRAKNSRSGAVKRW